MLKAAQPIGAASASSTASSFLRFTTRPRRASAATVSPTTAPQTPPMTEPAPAVIRK